MRRLFMVILLSLCWAHQPVFATVDSLRMTLLTPRNEKGLNDPLPQGDFDVLAIPLKRVQNLYLIEASIDSLRGNFILDTGAPRLVLNKTYFSSGRPAPGSSQYGITGGANTVLNTTVDSLIINELFYTNVDADIVNLGHLENARGVRILGLLGASLFNQMEMELDLANDLLYLYKLDEKGNRITGIDSSVADLMLPIINYNDILFVEGKIGNKKLKFCLDTGAEKNVLSESVSNKVLSHFTLTKSGNLTGSGGTGTLVLNGVIDSIGIGSTYFRDMPFLLTNLSYLELVYGTSLSGILGYDFLAKGKVRINVKKQEISMYFYKPEQDE